MKTPLHKTTTVFRPVQMKWELHLTIHKLELRVENGECSIIDFYQVSANFWVTRFSNFHQFRNLTNIRDRQAFKSRLYTGYKRSGSKPIFMTKNATKVLTSWIRSIQGIENYSLACARIKSALPEGWLRTASILYDRFSALNKRSNRPCVLYIAVGLIWLSYRQTMSRL